MQSTADGFVFVAINFDDFNGVSKFFSDLFEFFGEKDAGTTPCSEEIDDDGAFTVGYFDFKLLFCYLFDLEKERTVAGGEEGQQEEFWNISEI